MEQKRGDNAARQKVLTSIIDAGKAAFDPETPENSRAQAVRDFEDLIQRQAKPVSPLHASQV